METDLSQAFAGRIEPIRTSLPYRLSIVLVAVAMVLLPLVYAAIVVLAAWAWWLYVTRLMPVVLDNTGNSTALLLSGVPVAAGAILVFFLLKPLLARRPRPAQPLTVERKEAPGLFELVERLCDTVGAPRPVRIDVDVQVNASASLRRGVWSLFSQDLVLTVGLPLVNGLSLRQFTGVLAHEFGHFSQGAGMRFGYLIRVVAFWFAQVVFARDAWDLRLEHWAKSSRWWVTQLMWNTGRLCVWVSRRILHALMLLGHSISMLLSRQMEFDADQAEIRTVGSKTFVETSKRLHVLDLASRWAHGDLSLAWKKRRLGDDVPALIAANLRQMKSEVVDQVMEKAMDSTPGMYDSHPPTGQRIAKAEERPCGGVFRFDGDARELFGDFSALCRRASVHYYQQILPDEFRPESLVSTDSVAAEGERLTRLTQARIRYFGEVFDGSCWVRLPDPAGDRPSLEQLEQLYKASRDEIAGAVEKRRECDEIYNRSIVLHQVLGYAGAELKFAPEQFGMSTAEVPQLEWELGEMKRKFAAACLALEQGCPSLMAHLAARLAALDGRMPEVWLKTLALLKDKEELLNALLWASEAYSALSAQEQANAEHQPLQRELRHGSLRLERALKDYTASFGDAPHPLADKEGETLRAHLSEAPDPAGVWERAHVAVSRANDLYLNLLGRLAADVEPEPAEMP